MFIDVYWCLYWCLLMFSLILFVIVSNCRIWIHVVEYICNIPLYYPSLSFVIINSDWLDRIFPPGVVFGHPCYTARLLQSRWLTKTPSNCCCGNSCNAIRKTCRALWRQALIKKWTETTVLLPKYGDSSQVRCWLSLSPFSLTPRRRWMISIPKTKRTWKARWERSRSSRRLSSLNYRHGTTP